MAEIPLEWVVAGLVELLVLTLAALGIKMSRKNGKDTNGLGKSVREEMEKLRTDLARDRMIEDMQRELKELRRENEKLRRD